MNIKNTSAWEEKNDKIEKLKKRLGAMANRTLLLAETLSPNGNNPLSKEDHELLRAAVMPEVREACELAAARFLLGHDHEAIAHSIFGAMREAEV
jgi:hypothetical protein